MQIDLNGKVAIVTGAGRGIGREIALTLAAEGAITVILDVRQEPLDELKQLFAQKGWQGAQFVCDVRDGAGIHEVIEQIVEQYGRIDVLVNNAGVARGGAVESLSEDDWDANHDINLKGTFLMCKAVIPTMKRQRSGRIINAASFAAIVPALEGAAYASSKAGVVYFTRVLAGELGPWGITVNCYAPGMIPTEMNHFTEAKPRRQEQLLDTLTLRRWGEPHDIANLICFLASEQAAYITGSLIDISGGKLATQIPRLAYERAAEEGAYSFE